MCACLWEDRWAMCVSPCVHEDRQAARVRVHVSPFVSEDRRTARVYLCVHEDKHTARVFA